MEKVKINDKKWETCGETFIDDEPQHSLQPRARSLGETFGETFIDDSEYLLSELDI
jgi:hypothetical protein